MNAEAREALERLRGKVFPQPNGGIGCWFTGRLQEFDSDLVRVAAWALSEFRPDDGEAVTEEWLLSVGFESVPSQMGPNYSDHYQLGKMNIWNFNGTGEWLLNDADWITMKTRYDVRQLCRGLGITLKEPTNA